MVGLKSRRENANGTQKTQREFLIKKFESGQRDEQKVALEMQESSSEFRPDEFLTATQIRSFWFRLAHQRKKDDDSEVSHGGQNPWHIRGIEDDEEKTEVDIDGAANDYFLGNGTG